VVAIFIMTSIVPGLSTGNSSKFSLQNNSIFSVDNIKIIAENNDDTIIINYKINKFTRQQLEINGKTYTKILLNDESHLKIKGKPNLPNICRSIIISDNKKMDIVVIDAQYEEYENILIPPSKGVLKRSVNPEDVPYIFDEIYQDKCWFPEKIAELKTPYILRDFRGQVVQINPFQYNPVEETLRCYTDITVEIFPIESDTVNILTRTQQLDSIEVDFKQIYSRHFINFGIIGYPPVTEQGNMLIIVYDDFWDTMMSFVQWKNMKGVHTEMVNVSEIGDENAIMTYIKQYYNDSGLTFVLLVGDIAQVPTLTVGDYASDPSYSYIVGDDHYPDLFIGRFSAQNTSQLKTQVERSIEYEKYPQVGADWYNKGVGVASTKGVGDDGEYDYEHIRNIRTKLMNYSYIEVDELYDGSQGGEDAPGNPTPSMVAAALNDGCSIVNYCGHGGPRQWDTSGFHTSDIKNLVNDNMLPFVICVACNNGQFDDFNDCFCEALLRATNNGEPTGAIASSGSSKSMTWTPPMDAQDEMIDLIVESYTDNVKHTIGGIHANGCMHMNDEYDAAGYSETDTWHVFGDPSLQIRTNTSSTMTVNHEPSVLPRSTTFEVEVDGVKNALCAISQDFILLGYGYTDETGNALIEFFEPYDCEGVVDLVVTAYNMIPYMTTLNTNAAPEKPERPNGSKEGTPEETYSYSSAAEDPDEDQIYYMWDWGDGNYSSWLGTYDSGEICTESYSWNENGTYSVRVKAKDIYGMESEWSDPLEVIMPRVKIVSLFLEFLEQHFPRTYSYIIDLLEV
jgi:hypothetical protein